MKRIRTLEERFPQLWAALVEECGMVPDKTSDIRIDTSGVYLEVLTGFDKDGIRTETQKVKESNGTPSN